VTFDPNAGIVPNLDLHATAHVENPDPDPSRNAIGSADITVAVTGRPTLHDQLRIAAAYSQAQIVALLVDLPVLGSLNFGPGTLAGTLRGAPGESDAFLPPGVTRIKPASRRSSKRRSRCSIRSSPSACSLRSRTHSAARPA